MADDNESVVTANSTKPMVGDLADQNSPAAHPANKSSPELTRTSSPEPKKADEANLNRRHQQEFNKMKSSDAMRTLLKADEQVEKKQKLVTTALRVSSRTEFEARRSGQQPRHRSKTGSQPERSDSRSQSRGRASSRWRRGVTQSSLEREAQESARRTAEQKKTQLEYPSWWQGNEEIEKERRQD